MGLGHVGTHAVLTCGVPCRSMPCRAVPCHGTCCAAPCHAVLYFAVLLAAFHDREFAGPATYVDRGDPTNMTCAGAIQDAVYSAGQQPYWFVASTNGGVWRTVSTGRVPGGKLYNAIL